MELFAVIMAGGVGTRFWPRSREKTPKQLLRIFGEQTMIQNTVQRLNGVVPPERIFVITNKIQQDEIIRQLPGVPPANVIAEPFGRNTAACIGLASLLVAAKNPEAVTIVLPADHLIREEDKFRATITLGAEYAYANKCLTTIGIPPTRPETGYGYIQVDAAAEGRVCKVNSFAEKPNYATALRFLESGDFYWNSGMFIWRADAILAELRLHMPELHESLSELQPYIGTGMFESRLAEVYGKIKSISIDYGVMEKSRRVFLVKSDFVWSDVGSWEEVYQVSEKDQHGNVLSGNVYTDMTVDSYIHTGGKFTAVIGVENLIVIDTGDSLLICRRDRSQDVKNVVDHLKHSKQTGLL